MLNPSDRVTRNGRTLTHRMWMIIEDVERDTGVSLRVVQGSFNKGGVAKSAGTHDGGGAVDISVAGMSEARAIEVVVAFRERNGAFWLRSPKYGWPARLGGPHIHGIVRDEPDLSSGARSQVVAYNCGRNGLASRRPDPFPRPKQLPFRMPGRSGPSEAAPKVTLANLRFGKTNDDVKDLQKALNATLGGPDLAVDGVYRLATDAKVRTHQKSRGMKVDPRGKSFVGPRQAESLGLRVV